MAIGMRPSLKPFKIKYGGMAYRGGGHPKKMCAIRCFSSPGACPERSRRIPCSPVPLVPDRGSLIARFLESPA